MSTPYTRQEMMAIATGREILEHYESCEAGT